MSCLQAAAKAAAAAEAASAARAAHEEACSTYTDEDAIADEVPSECLLALPFEGPLCTPLQGREITPFLHELMSVKALSSRKVAQMGSMLSGTCGDVRDDRHTVAVFDKAASMRSVSQKREHSVA